MGLGKVSGTRGAAVTTFCTDLGQRGLFLLYMITNKKEPFF